MEFDELKEKYTRLREFALENQRAEYRERADWNILFGKCRDLVEQIYKQEAANPTPDFTGIKWISAVDGRAYSAFSENDPIYGALAEK